MSILRNLVLAAAAGTLLAQPSRSAEVLFSCVLQSHGSGHEKRTFDVTIDQQAQRAQIGGNYSLPATISPTQISFSLNLSGSVFQYLIDRTSGLGTIAIKDQVIYSGICTIADPGHRAP
ncbi:MAG TPA: hypothetical protein VNZ02_06995 [Steroidobacteraceae bacterium]|jgi:hypothetical protein|nr:hypothetical protein [Steroidobacteraceae bacterium]